MGAPAEAPFSEFINRPRDTVAKLDAFHHSLLLRRRDAEDLVVTTASRADQARLVMASMTFLLHDLAHSDKVVRDALVRAVPKVFPWVRFLPDEDTEQFIGELFDTAFAAADLDNMTPVAQLITEWKHTAEVYADPELLRILRQDGGDFGPVEPPTR